METLGSIPLPLDSESIEMTNPYAPDESSATLFAERAWLQGALLSNIFYGMEVVLFCVCMNALVRQISRDNFKRHAMLIVFLVVVFLQGTLYMFSLAVFTDKAFIDDRNFPGGPNSYEMKMFEIPVDELGNVTFMIGLWIMDLLLVWRCLVIYGTCSRTIRWLVMPLPSLLWLASFVVGVLYLIQSRAVTIFGAVNITLASASLTLATNVIVTILIAGRLLVFRYHVSHLLGPNHASQYTNVAAILIESASMYTCFMAIYLATFAANNSIADLFTQCLGQVQAVSAFLIIYRVASGRGWTSQTDTQILTQASTNPIHLQNLSPMRFNTNTAETTAHETLGSSSDLFKTKIAVTKDVLNDRMSNSV